MAKKKGTFNAGWWNCFESFASELLNVDSYADGICFNVLSGAGITEREALAWLSGEGRNRKVESVVSQYLNIIRRSV